MSDVVLKAVSLLSYEDSSYDAIDEFAEADIDSVAAVKLDILEQETMCFKELLNMTASSSSGRVIAILDCCNRDDDFVSFWLGYS